VSSSHDRLHDLRFPDLVTFLAVARCGSVTAAARELEVTPSQVSKSIARLEQQFGVQLLTRGTRGVALTEEGLRFAPRCDEVVQRARALQPGDREPLPHLTFAAPSYLNALFLPPVVEALPQYRVRGLELPPALVRAYAASNFFDLTLTVGGGRLPDTWTCVPIGDIHKGLFAAPAVAKRLGPGPVPVERIRALHFINPVYNVNGQFVQADDDCPLRIGERRAGHEVQTLFVALDLAVRTDQVVFGPVIGAHPYLAKGSLVEIVVEGWDVSEPFFVACNGDRVTAPVLRTVTLALRAELARRTGAEVAEPPRTLRRSPTSSQLQR
jgi:DNA-binding transcriptional LysR family regulator